MRIRNARLSLILGVATFGAMLISPAAAQHGAHTPTLGKVQFKVECNEAAQREFNLAMAYYHSFAWSHLNEPLERV